MRNENSCKILGKEIGKVSVSMYVDTQTGLPFFQVNPSNTDVLQVSYIIEDVLVDF